MRLPLKIGTRHSALALLQTKKVADALERRDYPTEIKPIHSSGDIDLQSPLYEMGITGIFTKALDIALLGKDIDLAVHSMKDVPTQLPRGLSQIAVLKRDTVDDIMVCDDSFDTDKAITIATGSLRRRAQWLNRYPHHKVESIRGNLNLRLEKLRESKVWSGAIFAKAGLKRLDLIPKNVKNLNWMIPAPAQGAIVVLCRHEDITRFQDLFSHINHNPTSLCTGIERAFLRTLEGGCTAPIGAHATIKGNDIHFRGVLLSPDGNRRVDISKQTSIENIDVGITWANTLLEKGGRDIVEQLRHV